MRTLKDERREEPEAHQKSGLLNGFDTSIVGEKAKVGPAGIEIAYQRLGNPDAPLLLLIMGIAAQSIVWPDGFCQALVDRGLQVIRFDNRDVGLSTHLTDAPPPNLPAVLAGDLSSVSYTLSDMAADALGLLEVLGFEKAHLVGASMGGAIARRLGIRTTRAKSRHQQAAPTTAPTIRSASFVKRSPRSPPAIGPNACDISRFPPS